MTLKTSRLLVSFTVAFLLLAGRSQAAEQKRVFNLESCEHETSTGAYDCENKCKALSDVPAADMTSSGWKILSSAKKEVIAIKRDKWPGGDVGYGRGYLAPYTFGCTCKGTEYVIEKIDETQNTATVVNAVFVVSNNDADQYKKENEQLKKENEQLKKELQQLTAKKTSKKAKKKTKKKTN